MHWFKMLLKIAVLMAVAGHFINATPDNAQQVGLITVALLAAVCWVVVDAFRRGPGPT